MAFNVNANSHLNRRSRKSRSVGDDGAINGGILKKKKKRRKAIVKGCMEQGKEGGPEKLMCPYRGVRRRSTCGKWVAEISNPPVELMTESDGVIKTKPGNNCCLGAFTTAAEAALACDNPAVAIYGSNAILNFPDRHHHAGKVTHHDSGSSSNYTCTDANLKTDFAGLLPSLEYENNNQIDQCSVETRSKDMEEECRCPAEAEETPDPSFPHLGYESDYHGFWQNMLDNNGRLRPDETFTGNNVPSQNYSNLDDIKKMLLEGDEDEEANEPSKWDYFEESPNPENQNPTVEHHSTTDDTEVKMQKNPQEETENSERKEDNMEFGQFGSSRDLLDEILNFESFEFSDIIDGL